MVLIQSRKTAELAPRSALAVASASPADLPRVSDAVSTKAKAKSKTVMTATMKRRALKPKQAKTTLLQAAGQNTPQT
jgi:hypothetical protein